MLVSGEITMVMGGLAMLSALGEIAEAQAAAPVTFGLSEVFAILHAPAEFAFGGIIFAGGAMLSYGGIKTMWESGVPRWFYEKLPIASP